MIRILAIDDVSAIADIEAREQITPLPLKVLEKWFSNGYFGWGLEQNGQLYGYTIATRDGNQVYSTITCISKEFQSLGEGRKLCEHALQEVKKQGAELVVFEVRKSNIAELKMVEHFGAYCVDVRPNYYGNEDALIMHIDLRTLQ